jgi:hypothetical protein
MNSGITECFTFGIQQHGNTGMPARHTNALSPNITNVHITLKIDLPPCHHHCTLPPSYRAEMLFQQQSEANTSQRVAHWRTMREGKIELYQIQKEALAKISPPPAQMVCNIISTKTTAVYHLTHPTDPRGPSHTFYTSHYHIFSHFDVDHVPHVQPPSLRVQPLHVSCFIRITHSFPQYPHVICLRYITHTYLAWAHSPPTTLFATPTHLTCTVPHARLPHSAYSPHALSHLPPPDSSHVHSYAQFNLPACIYKHVRRTTPFFHHTSRPLTSSFHHPPLLLTPSFHHPSLPLPPSFHHPPLFIRLQYITRITAPPPIL